MSKYTPVFTRDGNTFIVPESDFVQDSAELADVAGIAAELVKEYGLTYTGRTEELSEDGKYPGPYVIATIRDKQAFIISGQSLVDAVLSGGAENVAPFVSTPVLGVDLASGPDFGTKESPKVTLTGGDHTGPDAVVNAL